MKHFFSRNIVHTNKYNKTLQSAGTLNIKRHLGIKKKECKKINK